MQRKWVKYRADPAVGTGAFGGVLFNDVSLAVVSLPCSTIEKKKATGRTGVR